MGVAIVIVLWNVSYRLVRIEGRVFSIHSSEVLFTGQSKGLVQAIEGRSMPKMQASIACESWEVAGLVGREVLTNGLQQVDLQIWFMDTWR